MLVFGLHSISDDQLSDLSEESQTNAKKRPPKSSKNEMLILELHSISDDQLSDLNEESQTKYKKSPPSHQKMKCSFWIMFNF